MGESQHPDPGSGSYFLTPGSGMGESQHPDPGSGSYFLELRNHIRVSLGLKYLLFYEDPGSGMESVLILDSGSGMEKSRIRDPG
jgi:hypothetical protein